MVLTDQQLRQELISHGETVPPITQRNREQLRARLELLRSQKRTRTPASPSRTQAAASPSRSQATASPSRAQVAAGSPSRVTRGTASPSTRSNVSPTRAAAASPSRATATNSPSRTRSSTTTASRSSTRSKQPVNLVELSDSDTEARQNRSGLTSPTVQTRSTGSRRQKESPSTSSSVSELAGPPNITNDVEQSSKCFFFVFG